MLAAAALTVIAIVTQDQTALRAAPRDSAPQQAALWQGDRLEIRGRKGDYLQVYDHRRERAGYVRAGQARVQSLKPEAAPEMLSVLRFLKDLPGSEALGIAYGTAYLKSAPSPEREGEAFDAIGTMAERLARRTSSRQSKAAAETTAAHLEVAAAYGVGMHSVERDGQVQLCYDGDADRRVLALPSTPEQKARAALALTRHECVPPSLTPAERFAHDHWRAEVLARVETRDLPEVAKNRLRLRKAGIWASLAYQRSRRADTGQASAQAAGTRAIEELAAINKSELMESDAAAYSDAAIRVGASRWAAFPAAPAGGTKPPARLSVVTKPGQPGETCIHLVDAKHDAANPLVTRCTYGVVWTASATANREGTALALAVQPLETWRELWLFRQGPEGWTIEALPPGLENPSLGYVEFAGWVPGSPLMLTAREIRTEGRYRQSFEVRNLATLNVEKQADRPGNLSTFYRWQDPLWKGQTVAVR